MNNNIKIELTRDEANFLITVLDRIQITGLKIAGFLLSIHTNLVKELKKEVAKNE